MPNDIDLHLNVFIRRLRREADDLELANRSSSDRTKHDVRVAELNNLADRIETFLSDRARARR